MSDRLGISYKTGMTESVRLGLIHTELNQLRDEAFHVDLKKISYINITKVVCYINNPQKCNCNESKYYEPSKKISLLYIIINKLKKAIFLS